MLRWLSTEEGRRSTRSVAQRGELASGGTGKSAAIVRQHYSTTLMARLAKRSVDIFRTMPEEIGNDGGYRRVGYFFICSNENVVVAKNNVEMQRKLEIDTEWQMPNQSQHDLNG